MSFEFCLYVIELEKKKLEFYCYYKLCLEFFIHCEYGYHLGYHIFGKFY